jgi:hypothetical protein
MQVSMRTNKIALKTIIFLMVFSLFGIASARAEEIVSPSGFSVEPAILHVSVAPGMQFKSGISLRNTGGERIALSIRVVDFTPENEYGGVLEREGVGPKDDPLRASGWFSLPGERIVIPPKQKLIIPFSISTPEDASPGGQSVAFVIESADGNVHSRVNALCFLTVSGDAKEDLAFLRHTFTPFISAKPEGVFHLELRNEGKTHVRPEGELVVRNMFGALRGKFALKESRTLGTLIPGAKRSFEYKWSGSLSVFDFGLWNVRTELHYGVNGNHVIADRLFFVVLPWRALLLSIIILGGALYFFVFAVKTFRNDMADMKAGDPDAVVSKISMRLLIIPIVAGALLLIVVTSVLFSVLQQKGEGRLERVQKTQN